jgi:hypothetical protein
MMPYVFAGSLAAGSLLPDRVGARVACGRSQELRFYFVHEMRCAI